MQPFEKIRKAVGDKMDIHVEFHSLWNLPTAIKIAKALEQFDPFWYEDPIKMDNLDAIAEYAPPHQRLGDRERDAGHALGVPRLVREARRRACACSTWAGPAGLTESKKIATMAEAYQLPVAPHDCTGPILLTASVHLSLNCPNTWCRRWCGRSTSTGTASW